MTRGKSDMSSLKISKICLLLLEILFIAFLFTNFPIVSSTSPSIDLYSQKGGVGPNQPSPEFSPGDNVILYALVTYSNVPIEGKLVGFEVRDAGGEIVLHRTVQTGDSGLAIVDFRLPVTCNDGQKVIGEWFAIAVVEIAETIINDTMSFRVTGVMIDLYTQRGGRGPSNPSDAFAPQEEVLLFAHVSFDCNPTEGKLVGFEVRDANGECVTYNSATTNASGDAVTNFRIPSMPSFGNWSAIATVEVLGKTVSDDLTFRVGWIIEILEIKTVDQNGNLRTVFKKSEEVYFNITIQNIAWQPKIATLTVTAYDEKSVPIGQVVLRDWVVNSETTTITIANILIPRWTLIQTATAYANAYTDLPSLGGVPYSPEISTSFLIVLV
jgi:hypothetical protein